MPQDLSRPDDPPAYAGRFGWHTPLPTPATWKPDAKRISRPEFAVS